MNKKINVVIIIIVVVAILAIGGLAWSFLKPTEQASTPIQSIPLETNNNQPSAESDDNVETTTQLTIFEIIPSESEARFSLDELLRGEPTTVVGKTDQVSGQIGIDPNNPTAAQLGIIQINARTLATDNRFRNRAIANRILLTNQFEYIRFAPKAIDGLPETVAVGDSFTFKVNGDLTVTDVTQEVVFEVTVTPISETRLQGIGTATVLHRDFNLTIPQVDHVADVDEEVLLEIEFIAETSGT